MRFKLFEKKTSNLFAENRLLKLAVVVIGVVEIFNSCKIDEAMHYQRTVLVPAGLDRRVTLTGDQACEEYVRIFARQITNLAFTYNTASARGQFGELLQWFAPEQFPQAKQEFFSLADTIERTKLSSSFAITKPIEVDYEKKVLTVEGAQREWVESNFVDTSEKTYFISYKIVDGRFMVVAIDEKKAPAAGSSAAKTQALANGGRTNAPK